MAAPLRSVTTSAALVKMAPPPLLSRWLPSSLAAGDLLVRPSRSPLGALDELLRRPREHSITAPGRRREGTQSRPPAVKMAEQGGRAAAVAAVAAIRPGRGAPTLSWPGHSRPARRRGPAVAARAQSPTRRCRWQGWRTQWMGPRPGPPAAGAAGRRASGDWAPGGHCLATPAPGLRARRRCAAAVRVARADAA